MLDRIGQIFRGLRGGSLRLIGAAGCVLLAWGMTAPVGTIVWWLNEGAESLGLRILGQPRAPLPAPSSQPDTRSIDCYIVFLSGVGDFSADQLTNGETYFLAQLVQAHPHCVAVDDVFPYSAANESLGGRRLLAPFWQFVNDGKGVWAFTGTLIRIRNLWRFAISTDDRYGTIYNQGIATAILDRMNAAYPLGKTRPDRLHIILVGTSGGAQVALGAAPYLQEWLGEPRLTLVSVGGVFSGSRGFDALQEVYHLRGDRDWIEDIGKIFPSRWVWVVGSPFNRARRSGEYSVYRTGNHEHDGEQSTLR